MATMARPKSSSVVVGPTEASMMIVDLSGFTRLLHAASRDVKLTKRILHAVQRLFAYSVAETESLDFNLVNTTGDGFLALATGATPSRTALVAARAIRQRFEQRFPGVLASLPFRARLDLRVALHHGTVYAYSIPRLLNDMVLYNSDDLNMVSRVVTSATARRRGAVCTRPFITRIMLRAPAEPPLEVILDAALYPEPIEVFALPTDIPELRAKRPR